MYVITNWNCLQGYFLAMLISFHCTNNYKISLPKLTCTYLMHTEHCQAYNLSYRPTCTRVCWLYISTNHTKYNFSKSPGSSIMFHYMYLLWYTCILEQLQCMSNVSYYSLGCQYQWTNMSELYPRLAGLVHTVHLHHSIVPTQQDLLASITCHIVARYAADPWKTHKHTQVWETGMTWVTPTPPLLMAMLGHRYCTTWDNSCGSKLSRSKGSYFLSRYWTGLKWHPVLKVWKQFQHKHSKVM